MAVKIIFFIVISILATIEIYSNKLLNFKRGLSLFISTIIIPFVAGYTFKMMDLKIDRENGMIMAYVIMSLWVILVLSGFPYMVYGMFRIQVWFHKKYNVQNKQVGENLEELGSKENLKTEHKVIKIICIPLAYLMLYGVWFGTK